MYVKFGRGLSDVHFSPILRIYTRSRGATAVNLSPDGCLSATPHSLLRSSAYNPALFACSPEALLEVYRFGACRIFVLSLPCRRRFRRRNSPCFAEKVLLSFRRSLRRKFVTIRRYPRAPAVTSLYWRSLDRNVLVVGSKGFPRLTWLGHRQQ